MTKYGWCRAQIETGTDIVEYGDGGRSMLYGDTLSFMKKAGKNGKAFLKASHVLLYYNSETGDICIPYISLLSPAQIDKIKKAFLRFISKDDHEDVPYKTVEIED